MTKNFAIKSDIAWMEIIPSTFAFITLVKRLSVSLTGECIDSAVKKLAQPCVFLIEFQYIKVFYVIGFVVYLFFILHV